MITVSQQPQAYMPYKNGQIFTASSDQVAQPNFMYTVIITDLKSSTAKTYQIPQRPDTLLVFDAAPYVRSFFEDHYIPINLYGFQQSDSIRAIRVNIGETYGATPAYTAGSNINYIAWNSVVDWLDFPSYDYTDYVFDSAIPRERYLTSLLPDCTFEDRSQYLYALTSNSGDIPSITIEALDASGTFISFSYIANPYESGVVYDDKYLAIDLGHKGLTNISSGDVTGAYPILTDSVYSYKVYAGSTHIKTYTICCEDEYPVYTIHYLNKAGAFETLHFNKRSDTELRKETTTYKKNPNVMSGGSYTYSRSAALERILTTKRTEKLTLNTDWLDEDHTDLHKEIIDSPVIYLDLGSDQDYVQLRLVTNTYKVNKMYNEPLFSLTMDFEYSHDNTRQDG